MNRAENKAERILQVEALLLAHPEGLSPAGIARRLMVNRSTISRYLKDLPKHIYIEDDGKLKIDRQGYLVNVRLNLHEALAMHLATRLLARRMDRQNPYAGSALRKLGAALERLAPRISAHMMQSADVMDDASRRQDPVYLQVLERLTLSWAEQRKAQVWHRHEATGEVRQYVFAPYFIEPYAVGQSTHVIGWREPPGKLRTFKIERIEQVEVLQETYTIPEDFNPRQVLGDAWGIWFTEGAPERVRLRFMPGRAARRVKESLWHPTQAIEELPDGGLIWSAQVAEWREMLPWVRGWGAEVEVLEPGEMRQDLIQDVKRMSCKYNIGSTTEKQGEKTNRLMRLWGKTLRDGLNAQAFHPALFHMLDVGNAASRLLGEEVSPRWRYVLGRALGCDPDGLKDWLPWLAAMHDVGKISAAFQEVAPLQRARLVEEGFSFGSGNWQNDPYHAVTSAVFIQEGLDGLSLPDGLRRAWSDAIAAHHGQFIRQDQIRDAQRRLKSEPPEWGVLRQQASRRLQEIFVKSSESWPDPAHLSAAIMALAGFIVVCDWLGSNEEYFTPQPDASLEDYLLVSQVRAEQAIEHAGLAQVVFSPVETGFSVLFPKLGDPRPLQLAIEEVPKEVLAQPSLAIIEAPTGEGKTEAALALAHRMAAATRTNELYYALPTMATSNQMFIRLQHYLYQNLGLNERIKLIHGQAGLIEDDLVIQATCNGPEIPPAPAWFGADKRKAMVMPFGVGTVDQAELAALNVRFTQLRLAGLAGKVVIFDEVHAYDNYMTTIVERLLSWLAALGSPVILLSATLPLAQRRRLAAAYVGEACMGEEQTAYPSLWVVGPNGMHSATPPASQPDRRIKLDTETLTWGDEQAQEKASWLLEQVADGGCACWVTNTVERAQQLYDAVDHLAPQGVDRMLLHARFPLDDRLRLEERLVQRYGPADGRPERGIVIGTQVLEQSLDLDFDLMISDLAPIDFLLQRAGRMHRHAYHRRPAAHTQPRLWINLPRDEAGQPDLQVDRWVYERYFLLKTWQALNGRTELVLPGDYRLLIEQVYAEESPEAISPLYPAWGELSRNNEKARGEASQRLLPAPDPVDSFCGRAARLIFDEDENRAGWIVAQTRLGEESLNVIPLERGEGTVRLWSGDGMGLEIKLDKAAPFAIQKQMLRRSLRLSHRAGVEALKRERAAPPALFSESALLKDCQPLWLVNGQAELTVAKGRLVLKMDPRLGLIIQKGA